MADSLREPAEFAVFDGDLDDHWTERYLQVTTVAVDTEAMGLIHGRDRLCLVQIADEHDRVCCVRIGLGQQSAPNLKRVLEAQNVEKIFHFARFDVAALATGLAINVAPLFCTKVGSRLARTYTPRHGLKDLVMELVGVELEVQQLIWMQTVPSLSNSASLKTRQGICFCSWLNLKSYSNQSLNEPCFM